MDNNYKDGVDYRTAVDYLEPLHTDNPYREAALRYTVIMSLALNFIAESKEPRSAAFAVAYALEMQSVFEGQSARQIARDIGVSSNSISNLAKRFKQYANL